ncbi:MAG: hypothetical protein WBC76_12330 [Actinomycetes bacterium]
MNALSGAVIIDGDIHQQRAASEQVVQAMSQVAAMSQEFAAESRQTSASAEEITELASDFSAAIDRFDVSGATAPVQPRPGEAPAGRIAQERSN